MVKYLVDCYRTSNDRNGNARRVIRVIEVLPDDVNVYHFKVHYYVPRNVNELREYMDPPVGNTEFHYLGVTNIGKGQYNNLLTKTKEENASK